MCVLQGPGLSGPPFHLQPLLPAAACARTSVVMVEVYTLRSYSQPSRQRSVDTLDRSTSRPGSKPRSEKAFRSSSRYREHLLRTGAPPWLSSSSGMLLFRHAAERLTCAGTRHACAGVSATKTMEMALNPLGTTVTQSRKNTSRWKRPHGPRKAVAAS